MSSTRFIRGGQPCVCFSEAPLGALQYGLINATGFTRYSPYGLQFEKECVFELGGRPVIYEPDDDFGVLPETHQWRHVRLEFGDRPVDFTWEREWRLPCSELRFSDSDVTVVLPDDAARDQFITDVEHDSFYDAWAWTMVMGDLAWQLDCGNPWKIVTLRSIDNPAAPNTGNVSRLAIGHHWPGVSDAGALSISKEKEMRDGFD